MRVAKRLGIVMASLLIGSCTTPMRQTGIQMVPYDRDTEYSVTPRESDFAITIYYSRYQFIPESNAVGVACKSALTSIAYEHAEKQGKGQRTNWDVVSNLVQFSEREHYAKCIRIFDLSANNAQI